MNTVYQQASSIEELYAKTQEQFPQLTVNDIYCLFQAFRNTNEIIRNI